MKMRKPSFMGLVPLAILLSANAQAADRSPSAADIRTQPLAISLRQLARQTGAELIFSASMVEGKTAPRLSDVRDPRIALTRLLAGTGLTFLVTADGAFVVVATSARPPVDDGAISEILVLGRRSQNADIRRGQSDIQPYDITSNEELVASHVQNLDEYFRSRITSNGQGRPPGQTPQTSGGRTRSEINLRGLGASQTLILVDGRRMPSLPSGASDLFQTDINGVPLQAVDRVEVLNSTAGGIYGPGATGGVVNLVLKRDYTGAELSTSYGITSRGDAAYRRVDGSLGLSLGGGRTSIALAFSKSESDDLKVGDRDFADRARALKFAHAPALFLADYPTGGGINIFSRTGLTLRPALGGTSLGSNLSHINLGYGGVESDAAAALIAGSGSVDLRLSPDGAGAEQSLVTTPSTSAVLFNVRQSLGGGAEAFVDYVRFQNDGRATAAQVSHTYSIFSGYAAASPFAQDVVVSFALPGFDTLYASRSVTSRVTGGLITPLPGGWRGEIDYSRGTASQVLRVQGSTLSYAARLSISYGGLLGDSTDTRPDLNPLGNWAQFLEDLESYRVRTDFTTKLKNHFQDGSVRLAGPVFTLPGGPLTVTLAAEARREAVPSTSTRSTYDDVGYKVAALPRIEQTVRSLSVEARAPIWSSEQGPWPLRGLELQVAVRHDRSRSTIPYNNADTVDLNQTLVTASNATTLYTAGLRFFPARTLMVRLSTATGATPPTTAQIARSSAIYSSGIYVLDPLRDDRQIGAEAPVEVVAGGSTGVTPETARSLSAGGVWTPFGDGRLRLSVDYTHIAKRREIVFVGYDLASFFVLSSSRYPALVTRAPLSAIDAAAGLQAGIVTRIEAPALNIGRTTLEAVDAKVDYLLATPNRGDFKFQTAVTWQPRFTRQSEGDAYSLVNYSDGALEWRGSATLAWSGGPASLAMSAQYFGAYRVAVSDSNYLYASAGITDQLNQRAILYQGSSKVAAQAYFDLAGSYSFDAGWRRLSDLQMRIGIQNLFDHRPPTVVGASLTSEALLGYSPYGDPRRRRFDITLAAKF